MHVLTDFLSNEEDTPDFEPVAPPQKQCSGLQAPHAGPQWVIWLEYRGSTKYKYAYTYGEEYKYGEEYRGSKTYGKFLLVSTVCGSFSGFSGFSP